MIKHIVVVGGGSAGWLSAAILASRARYDRGDCRGPRITVVESPTVATVGVGEGTWPSMRSTLKKIGVSETDFIRECDVSLKQGTRFNGWLTGNNEYYYHPFSLPNAFYQLNLAEFWSPNANQSFANAVCPQAALCDLGLSAKQISTPEFAFAVNYGYHLDAGKFAAFLRRHCCEKLSINHIVDHVDSVSNDAHGHIRALKLRDRGHLEADFFVDCSGFSALLIGQHYGVKANALDGILFNDRALAVQVPYVEQQTIQSTTHSSAQEAGWIWDIGLASRRGVGHVYSSRYLDDAVAESQLIAYVRQSLESQNVAESDQIVHNLSVNKLAFSPNYRITPWHKNCVAIGLSAGFVEPLEASALVLIETAATALANDLPQSSQHAMLLSKRFNQKMQRHWHQIVDFLKLHYVLSQRSDSDYWVAHRDKSSQTDTLLEKLLLWKYRAPWVEDTPMIDELFSAASFQYVLYGMGYEQDGQSKSAPPAIQQKVQQCFAEIQSQIKRLSALLPDNRTLNERVIQYGFQRV